MTREAASPEAIRVYTERLLHRADAAGRWPTPVGDILEASKLEQVEESPFADSMLARAPAHLRLAVRALRNGRIRGILDRRERTVYLDPAIDHDGRRNFVALHEVTHDLLPWQQELAYADNDLSLSERVRRVFEREANQGAAELFFQGARFAKIAANYEIGVGAVGALSEQTGASLRATMRQFAESHRYPVCALALHPSPCQAAPLGFRRFEVSESPDWTRRFGGSWPQLLTTDGFPFLLCARDQARRDYVWPDRNNGAVALHAEVIPTPYSTLLLVWVARRERLRRKTRLERRAA